MLTMQVIKVALVVVIASIVIFSVAEAAYKKPPLNGSMFGKRNNIGECTRKN